MGGGKGKAMGGDKVTGRGKSERKGEAKGGGEVPGPRSQDPGPRSQVSGSRSQVPSPRSQVSGPGARFQKASETEGVQLQMFFSTGSNYRVLHMFLSMGLKSFMFCCLCSYVLFLNHSCFTHVLLPLFKVVQLTVLGH